MSDFHSNDNFGKKNSVSTQGQPLHYVFFRGHVSSSVGVNPSFIGNHAWVSALQKHHGLRTPASDVTPHYKRAHWAADVQHPCTRCSFIPANRSKIAINYEFFPSGGLRLQPLALQRGCELRLLSAFSNNFTAAIQSRWNEAGQELGPNPRNKWGGATSPILFLLLFVISPF